MKSPSWGVTSFAGTKRQDEDDSLQVGIATNDEAALSAPTMYSSGVLCCL